MSNTGGSASNRDLTDALENFGASAAKFLFSAGGLVTLITLLLVIFLTLNTRSATTAVDTQAVGNVDLLAKALYAGLLALFVGGTYTFWGEQVTGVLEVVFGAILYAAPYWVPLLVSNMNKTSTEAASTLQNGGIMFGILGLGATLVDITVRTNERLRKGAKAEQLKYGKGIKEENDNVNTFFGKCWQMPFCRKFVRENCPIFHAKRTCWRELVGCMCEEEVIRGALSNRAIPKDAVLAANYIPKNHKLTDDQKKARCKNCVIYNEHQRQKYKVAVPGMVVSIAAVFLIFLSPLLGITNKLVNSTTHAANSLVQNQGTSVAETDAGHFFAGFLLFIVFLLIVSYALKALEFLIFTLKV